MYIYFSSLEKYFTITLNATVTVIMWRCELEIGKTARGLQTHCSWHRVQKLQRGNQAFIVSSIEDLRMCDYNKEYKEHARKNLFFSLAPNKNFAGEKQVNNLTYFATHSLFQSYVQHSALWTPVLWGTYLKWKSVIKWKEVSLII